MSEQLLITLSRSMPLDEVEQYQSDSGIDEAERQSDAMPCSQTFQSDGHDSSLDSDGVWTRMAMVM